MSVIDDVAGAVESGRASLTAIQRDVASTSKALVAMQLTLVVLVFLILLALIPKRRS